jgi:hypothetical protein
LVLHLTDLHIGEVISLPENQYSIALSKKRLTAVFDEALWWGKEVYAKVSKVERLHIFLLGDMIHNELMRGSAKMTAETDFVEQIEAAADILADKIVNYVLKFPQIKYVYLNGVRGNHGRVGKFGEEAPNASFDRQVYDRLQLVMKLKISESEELKKRRVQWHYQFPKDAFVVHTVAGKLFGGEHGDGIRGQLGIPYYGIVKKRDRRYKQQRGKLDYHLFGHFHREYSEFDGGVEVLMSPSLSGMNEYAKDLGYDRLAGQMLYAVVPDRGVIAKHNIRVDHIGV